MPRRRGLAVGAPRTFAPAERAALEAGFVPRDMDDKWLAFVEDDRLHLVHSWTGYRIYKVRLTQTADGGATVAEIAVNDDREQFTGGDDSARAVLDDLLDRLSVREPAP